jgi:hypothetical protein
LPIRIDQYRTGPGEVNLTNNAVSKIGKEKIANKKDDRERSNARFKLLKAPRNGII